jgi:tellurium resistance protein TerD
MTLSLQKPGVTVPALQLSLAKGSTFKVKLTWDCHAGHEDDLDLHALEATNSGKGAKVSKLESILSTYNTTKMSRTGVLQNKPDGSFATPSGGLAHSGDIRVQGKESETLTINGSKIPDGVNEIPLFATVHKADHGEKHEAEHDDDDEAAFADIEVCTVTITDESGRELGSYTLSSEFGEFNVVQLGSVILNSNGGWEYAPVGVGFNGNFNEVLASFS